MKKKILRLEHPRHSHMVGDGFRVSQYIPGYGREMSNDTSPFLMLDYNTPWNIEPQINGHRPGVGYHPHRGFETVTIVYSGEVEHQDTAGNGGIIGPDEVQWMTAGSGLLHNEFMTERFSLTGGVQHAVQLWVNLPREHKMTTPRYQALTKDMIPEVNFDGGKVRVIAGCLSLLEKGGTESLGRSGGLVPEKSETPIPPTPLSQGGSAKTFSSVELYDVRFHSEGEITLTFPEGYNAMILVTEGSIIANEKSLENGDMLYFSREGEEITLQSKTPLNPPLTGGSTRILVMAGKPLDEPVASYGPFVMNTQSEIMQAFEDYRTGKMG